MWCKSIGCTSPGDPQAWFNERGYTLIIGVSTAGRNPPRALFFVRAYTVILCNVNST